MPRQAPVTTSSFTGLPSLILRTRLKRKHLRKYSWLPDVIRVKHSIILRIIGPVLTVTLFATLICYLELVKGKNITITNSVIPLLSVVVGLILVFRNGSSYDRWWEGRKSFSTCCSHVRNFTRLLWVNVNAPADDPTGKAPVTNMTEQQIHRHKTRTMKLALAFVIATKHYLRGEDGTNYDDYMGILPSRFDKDGNYNTTTVNTPHNGYSATGTASRTRSASPSVTPSVQGGQSTESGRNSPEPAKGNATKRVRVKRSHPKLPMVNQNTPLLGSTHRTIEFHGIDDASLPLPMMIAHELTRAIYIFRREGLLETVGPAGVNAMNMLIQGMVDSLSAMERVANTPIPVSYSIHLKQCITLYLFALPFTLVKELGWWTVGLVTVVAFTFMGIEGIADEIEMPFGTDISDLPLDRYCFDLKEEVQYTIAKLPEGGEGGSWFDDGEGDD